METTEGAKELLNRLHMEYMKRQSGTISFVCNGHGVAFSLNHGDIFTVRGDHFDQGGTFNDLLYGEVTHIQFHAGTDNSPGHPVERSMELILFELAVGMDKQLESSLDEVRKTGQLPKGIIRTAVVNHEKGGALDEQIFVMREGVNSIGRSDRCDVAVSDKAMSRKHAEIHVSGGTAKIVDLDSSNGVKVNRKLVKQMPLIDGNLLFMGNTVFRFFWTDSGTGVLFKMSQDSPGIEDQPTFIIPH
jgi:hypothetical protein